MRKRKSLIISLCLLAAVVALGVGYALTAENISINGTVNVGTTDDFHVHFSSAACGTNCSKAALGTVAHAASGKTTANYGSMSATMAVSLSSKGDKGTATFKIKNYSENINADFSAATVTVAEVTNGEYFTVNESAIQTAVQAFGTLKAGEESSEFTVEVELDKENITDSQVDGTFTITFSGVTATLD